MARYCFYCGRALSPGEKCQCREKPGGTESPHEPVGTRKSEDQTHHSRESATPRGGSRTSPFQKSKTAGSSTGKKQTGFRKPDRLAVLAGLQQFARLFTCPEDTIRQAVRYPDKRKAFLLLLVNCLLGGFLMLTLSRQSQAGLLLQLNIVQAQMRSGFMTGLFLFFQGIALTLCLQGLLLVLTYAALRWMIRQPVDLLRLLAAFGPLCFYVSVLLLMTILAVPGSLIHAALLLAGALTVSFLTLYLIIRQLCSVDENRLFMVTILILIVYCALVSFLFGLTLPLFSTLFDQSIIL